MTAPIVMGLAIVLALFALLYAVVYGLSHVPRAALPSESKYTSFKRDGTASDPRPLPSIDSPAEVAFTVVIPCYNESERLEIMLDEALPILNADFGDDWEVLLVNDASTDDTAGVALRWAAKNRVLQDQFRLINLNVNRGKGGAVIHGMKHARGKLVLFADADGASRFADSRLLRAAIGSKERAVAIGSRAHLVKSDAVVKRTFIRNFLMYGLHTLLYVFGIRTIGDTQCGFKMFTRAAARDIFPYMHTERWIFDVEALLISMRKSIPISEIAVNWHEVEGSKIDLARDSVLMAIDLVVIRFAYLLGIYSATKVSQPNS